MSDINSVALIGRLTADPELKQSGVSLIRFSLAVNRVSFKDSKREDKVSYINCVAFGKSAENIASFCKKGHRIAIEGHLQQNRWTGADGEKRQNIEVVVHSFMFLQPKTSAESSVDSVTETFSGTVMGDDIPF